MSRLLADFKLLLWKEWLHTFRDKDVLIYTFIVPAVIYPLLLVVGIECFIIAQEAGGKASTRYGVACDTASLAGKRKLQNVIAFLARDAKYEKVAGVLGPGDLFAGRVTVLLDEKPRKDKPGKTEVVGMTAGGMFSGRSVMGMNDSLERDFLKRMDEAVTARGYTPDDFKARPAVHKNVNARKAEVFSVALSLVFFSLFNVALGGAYPAIAATSEEFERNTIEPVMMLPVNRWFVILAKMTAVTGLALLGGVLNLVSMSGEGGLMVMSNASLKSNQALDLAVRLQPQQLPIVILLYIVIALVFSALMMMTASYCRTVRASQQWISLPLTVLMLLLLAALTPTVELNNATALVPLLNYLLITRNLFNGEACGTPLIIALVQLPILLLVVTRITAKMLYKR